MAFEIKKILGSHTHLVAGQIQGMIAQSRFTAEVRTHDKKVTIHNIRLRASKHYCGNHPNACPVRAFPTRHVHSKCLEGADWVAFNDMLNDVLDALNVSANVASSLCIIRKGALRRTEYHGHKLGNGIDSEWNKDTDAQYYVDRRNRITSRSLYPKDTPGIDAWKEGEADSRPAMLHTH